MNGARTLQRPRWRKVFTDLWANKTRTFLVVASIAVGVFTIGTIASAYIILAEDMNVSYANSNPANIEIVTDPFDEKFVDGIKKIPGVADAEGRHVMSARVSRDGVSWLSINIIGIRDYQQSKINKRDVIEGTYAPDERQILIEKSNFNESGILMDDILQVRLEDGTIRELPVVGIFQEQSTGQSDFMALPNGFVLMDTMDWLGRGDVYNRLFVTVAGDSNSDTVLRAIADLVEDKTEKSGRFVYQRTLNKTNEHPMSSLILAVLGVLGALGGLMVLLSTSLIANTLNALLTQHMRQIGVMKLIGARSFQIVAMYLVLILFFGLIASVIAVPLGGYAGYELAEYTAVQASINLQEFRYLSQVIILQIAVALVVPLAAGFIPVNRGSKTKVRRAISGQRSGEGQATTGLLQRLGVRFRWISRPVMLSIRNTFRQKQRLLLTLFTLIVGGAIFIAVFNVRASMEAWMEALGHHFIADVTLNFERPYRISEITREVLQVPGVAAVEGWSAAAGEILDPTDEALDTIQILAPPSDSPLLDPDIVAGRWLLPEESNALVVSDGIWDIYPDLQPGDTMRLEIMGERAEHWTVVGVFSFPGMLDSILGYADYAIISEMMNSTNQSFSYRVVTDEHTWEDQERIGRAVDSHLRVKGYQVGDVEAGKATMRDASEAISVLIGFLLIMALLTALVGSIGLTGTMGMNVLERNREIGVMRAIGAVDLKIVNSVIVEGLLIGLISWLFAILLSFPISYGLLGIISEAMINAPIPLAITPLGTALWLAVVILLSVVASVLPARNAARLTIREVLAYE